MAVRVLKIPGKATPEAVAGWIDDSCSCIFCLPPDATGNDWTVVVDTASGEVAINGGKRTITAGENFELPGRSLLLLRR